MRVRVLNTCTLGQPVPLVRQRPQRLDEQSQLLGAHRQLAGLGLEQRSFCAEHVADVPALELVVGRAERLALREQLQLPGAVRNLREARLAHDALGEHAAADLHADDVLVVRVRGAPCDSCAQLVELGSAFGDELVFVVRHHNPCLRLASRN
jgi:hypothetical protein